MPRAQNPMRRGYLAKGEGGWIAHRLELLVSPAWRHRPVPLIRLLERLEIEHLRHAGRENGRLQVAYPQFENAGVSRRAIGPAIDCGVALGLLDVTQPAEIVGNLRPPNLYRLTYVPMDGKRAPTDEWAGITTEAAEDAVSAFQATQKKSRGQCPNVTPPSAPMSQKKRPPSAPMSQIPVPHGAHSLTSGGNAAGSEPGERVLADDERTLLRWMQGYDGLPTHRVTQQRLSGVLTGRQITAAAVGLVENGLLTMEEMPNERGGVSMVYQLTPAGRSPSLVGDPRQTDLERWLAEAVR